MANPRVHEIAAELGVPTAFVLDTMKSMGEFVKSGASSVAPPVARRVRAAVAAREGVVVRLPLTAAAILERLPVALPLLVDTIIDAETEGRSTLSVLRAAAASKFMLHVGRTAAGLLAGRREPTLGMDSLPEPAGLAAVRTGIELLLLSWRLDDGRLNLSLLRVDREVARVVERGRADLLDGEFAPVGRDDVSRSLAVLARIPHVIPAAGAGPEVEDTDAPGTPSSPTPDPDIRVIYLTRGRGEATGLRAAVTRASRWVVRGHYRDQWYPSLGEHRRIWIAEHEAGHPDAPVRVRRIVYALR